MRHPRRSPFRALAALVLLLPLSQVLAGGFGGQWSGQLQGASASAQFQDSGGKASGPYVVDGYTYQLQFQHDGTRGSGLLSDPKLGGTAPLKVTLQGDTLQLQIFMHGADAAPIEARLQRGASGLGAAQPQAPASPGAMPGGALDSRLIGTWSYSTSYTSGEFTMASEEIYILHADGRLVVGPSTLAGGTADVSGSSGGGGGGAGRWSTRDRVLYVNDGSGWQPVAQYFVDGANMLLKRDGSNQVWNRR